MYIIRKISAASELQLSFVFLALITITFPQAI